VAKVGDGSAVGTGLAVGGGVPVANGALPFGPPLLKTKTAVNPTTASRTPIRASPCAVPGHASDARGRAGVRLDFSVSKSNRHDRQRREDATRRVPQAGQMIVKLDASHRRIRQWTGTRYRAHVGLDDPVTS
jgi:hypothetical protein